MSVDDVTYAPAGDQGIVICFGNVISKAINQRIRCVIEKIKQKPIKGVYEVIPSYTSLLVLYDRHKTDYKKIRKCLQEYCNISEEKYSTKKKIHIIPVCYEDRFSLDLKDVAKNSNLSENEVIDIHCKNDYLIYMLGFLPGFVYLGGLDDRIACPRLETPRTKIPAGGVGIGGQQTGIYPLESPGGWRIIGQTPINVYDSDRDPSILYEMGDYIRFNPISSSEYDKIRESVIEGSYIHRIEEVDQ